MRNIIIGILVVGLFGIGFFTGGCEDSLEFLDVTTTSTTTTTTTTTSTTTITLPQVATPTFSPTPGTYEEETLTITIECSTPGAQIFYTLSGANATSVSAFGTNLSISRSQTITAFAIKSGYENSETAVATYELWGWQALGSGVNDDVYSLAFDSSGNLYAGGDFNHAGALNAYYIAKWDGSSWEAFADQPDIPMVRAVAHDGTNLYIGGDFTSIGGKTMKHIAKWNGSSWEPLGPGLFDNYVKAITIDEDGDVYVGGTFTSVEGVANTGYLAKWNAAQSTWEAVGAGVNDNVNCFAFDDNGDLYVGGVFNSAGGVNGTAYIAKWDTSAATWESLGGNLNDSVVALFYDSPRDYLYVGGDFGTAGGNTNANSVARWDHISWSPLGTGMDNTVKALAVDYYGNVYAGGNFTTTFDGVPANFIAKWNGSSWSQVGSGMEDDVLTLTFDDSRTLYAGGKFVAAGSVATLRVAKWAKK